MLGERPCCDVTHYHHVIIEVDTKVQNIDPIQIEATQKQPKLNAIKKMYMKSNIVKKNYGLPTGLQASNPTPPCKPRPNADAGLFPFLFLMPACTGMPQLCKCLMS
jgi:hypothetical protein